MSHPGARPWGPNGELVDPPADGDDQARCWMMLGNSDGTGSQCLLFNGHGGEHQWRRADDMQEELARYGGLIAVARNAHDVGQPIHVGIEKSCQENVAGPASSARQRALEACWDWYTTTHADHFGHDHHCGQSANDAPDPSKCSCGWADLVVAEAALRADQVAPSGVGGSDGS